VEAKPSGIVLQWQHPGGDGIMFVILWTKSGKFHPVDETDGVPIDKERGLFQYREELPTSGDSQYQVRAFRHESWEQSEPSNVVSVSIQGPAAGDV
jgi:hypothetical protein